HAGQDAVDSERPAEERSLRLLLHHGESFESSGQLLARRPTNVTRGDLREEDLQLLVSTEAGVQLRQLADRSVGQGTRAGLAFPCEESPCPFPAIDGAGEIARAPID